MAKEWGNWQKFDACTLLGVEESEHILKTVDRDLILEPRVAYRNKNAGKSDMEEQPMARPLTCGYKVEELVSADGSPMKRESPTVSRLGFFLLLQTIASLSLCLFGADMIPIMP